MKAEVKQKWIEALRSGQYNQGKNALKKETIQGVEHCCLGVLCELAIKDGVEIDVHQSTCTLAPNGAVSFNESHDFLPTVVQDWAELHTESIYVRKESEEIGVHMLNDTGHSFAQIADLIEAQL
jgi:hypothetical protein